MRIEGSVRTMSEWFRKAAVEFFDLATASERLAQITCKPSFGPDWALSFAAHLDNSVYLYATPISSASCVMSCQLKPTGHTPAQHKAARHVCTSDNNILPEWSFQPSDAHAPVGKRSDLL